jgi:hypothetical protein
MTQFREFCWITFAREDRVQDTQAAQTRDLAQHMMKLQVHLIE